MSGFELTTEPFEIRPATPADAPVIAGIIGIGHLASHDVTFDDGDVYKELVTDWCGYDGQEAVERYLKESVELAPESAAAWVAVDGIGAVVGFAAGRDRVVGGLSGRNLDYMFVDERVRRQRVGSLLMGAYGDWVGDAEQMMLEVVETNRAAREMYEKFGFAEVPGSTRERTYAGRTFRFQQMVRMAEAVQVVA